MEFTYSDDLWSDLHKDVHGFRPSAIFMKNLLAFDEETKQNLWDALCEQLEENTAAEKAAEVVAIEKFEARIEDIIELGAGNRTNALLWMSGTETFHHIQDVEHFVWEQGILFTQYGKQLVKDLAAIVDYKEYYYA
tara:strand:- start:2448 stop:2855 length:408 start_codon:yes stop_codon:yes gene_type:complete